MKVDKQPWEKVPVPASGTNRSGKWLVMCPEYSAAVTSEERAEVVRKRHDESLCPHTHIIVPPGGDWCFKP